MIYIVIDLSSLVFAYKIIEFGTIIGAASSLIFPLTYSIMDVIAEVYGYKTAKKIIWFGFSCDLIFATLALMISYIPSIDQSQTTAYAQVLGSLLRAVIAQMIGVICGAILNIYLISKWKIITNGRYFWLRSIGASAIGEGIMLIISVLIALTGILSFNQITRLICFTYIYKIAFAIVAAPFINILANMLKFKMQNWNVNYQTFNPFNDTRNNQDFLTNSQRP